VAAALLLLFFRGVDLGAVWTAMGSARLSWIAGCLALTLLHFLLRAWRWRLLLSPIRIAVPMRSLVEAILAGYAVTFVIPGRLGEVVRPALLARRESLPLPSTLSTVGLDRVLDAAALVLLLIVFLLVAPSSGPGALPAEHAASLRDAGWTAGAVLAIALPALWLLARIRHRVPRSPAGASGWRSRGLGLVRSFLDGLAVLHGPRPLTGAVVGSLIIWLVLAGQAWCGIKAFGIDLPYTGALALVSFLALGIALPTPAGVGGFHYAGRFCLEQVFQVPSSLAVTAVLILHFIAVLPAIALGGWVLAREGASVGELLSRNKNPSGTEIVAERR
jgi:uncharacterized membrane protein YbhN (UPF0104 family)